MKKILYLDPHNNSPLALLQEILKKRMASNVNLMKRLFPSGSDDLKTLILSDGATRLKKLLPPGSPELKSLMTCEGMIRLKKLLPPDSPELKSLMTCDGMARLKNLLSYDSKELFQIMFENDAIRLKNLLTSNNYLDKITRLLEWCFPPESQVLFNLMRSDNEARLFAVLSQKDFYLAEKIFSAHTPLVDVVFSMNNYKVLRQFLFNDDYNSLIHVLGYDTKGITYSLLLRDDSPVFQFLKSDASKHILRELLFKKGLMHQIVQEKHARLWCKFEEEWDKIKIWFPDSNSQLESQRKINREQLNYSKRISDCLVDTILENERIIFRNGVLRFTERHSLYTLINEILVNEDYFAPIENITPRIIDCGAHQGLSLFYFKTIFPNARIIAFEPDPENRIIAEENVLKNNFDDIEILPYAIAGEEGLKRFYRYRGQSMANSLVDRCKQIDSTGIEEIDVVCVKLSKYLNEQVDYLKIDIEGAEDLVLAECENHLRNVRYLFCEYHHLPGLPTNRLITILDILQRAGFKFHVTKAYNFSKRSEFRPMNYIDEYYSAIIFAKNNNSPT